MTGTGSEERVGFILKDGSIVEVKNVAPNPVSGFDVSAEDILKYLVAGEAAATWHTHPGQDANLSVDDHAGFLNYPDLTHYIVGSDGIRAYKVEDGTVFNV